MAQRQATTDEIMAAYSAGICDALAIMFGEIQILSKLLDEKKIVSLAEIEAKKPLPQKDFQELVKSLNQIVRDRTKTRLASILNPPAIH